MQAASLTRWTPLKGRHPLVGRGTAPKAHGRSGRVGIRQLAKTQDETLGQAIGVAAPVEERTQVPGLVRSEDVGVKTRAEDGRLDASLQSSNQAKAVGNKPIGVLLELRRALQWADRDRLGGPAHDRRSHGPVRLPDGPPTGIDRADRNAVMRARADARGDPRNGPRRGPIEANATGPGRGVLRLWNPNSPTRSLDESWTQRFGVSCAR